MTSSSITKQDLLTLFHTGAMGDTQRLPLSGAMGKCLHDWLKRYTLSLYKIMTKHDKKMHEVKLGMRQNMIACKYKRAAGDMDPVQSG